MALNRSERAGRQVYAGVVNASLAGRCSASGCERVPGDVDAEHGVWDLESAEVVRACGGRQDAELSEASGVLTQKEREVTAVARVGGADWAEALGADTLVPAAVEADGECVAVGGTLIEGDHEQPGAVGIPGQRAYLVGELVVV